MLTLGSLGRKKRSPDDPRDIRLASILTQDSSGTPKYDAPPFARNWITRQKYEWLMNDRLGCCTITGIAHLMQNFAYCHGEELRFTDGEIVDAYSAVTGYRPGDPSTDRGGLMVHALTYARNVGIGGKKIGAFARVNYSDWREVQAAISLLGGLYVGARLPKRIAEQDVLLVPAVMTDRDAPNSLGGHAFCMLGYDRLFFQTLLWRDPKAASKAWFNLYVDEAWVIIDERWVNGKTRAPNGLDVNRLLKNLEEIGR